MTKLNLKADLWAEHPDKTEVSLKTLAPHLQFSVNLDNSTLNIAVAHSWFEPQIIALKKKQPTKTTRHVLLPQPFAAFLNYQLGSSFNENTYLDNLDVPWELGLNRKQWFVSSTFNAKYTTTAGLNMLRLQTQLIWDDPQRMNRFIWGDFTVPSRGLSSSGQFAGFAWQREFGLDQTFKYTPDFDLQTVIEKPSYA